MERARRDVVAGAYRIYISDSLRSIPQGAYLIRRWADIVEPKPDIDADQIIEKIDRALGGEQ